MRALVIIDPQVDFISGTLPVPQAEEAMRYLAQWMLENESAYDLVYVSMDQHPINHCSFESQGGPWPSHCVRYSPGAAIHEGVMQSLKVLQSRGKTIHFIEKAYTPETDSYSAFAEQIPTPLLSAERIYLAGLAGDYCVAASQEDLQRAIASERIERLEPAIAWITPPSEKA